MNVLRVAAYCRVSTDKSDQANSFESQQRYFRERIAREASWELQDIYADEGLSGTSTKKRAQFNRMIQAARAGEIDLIITKEVSRFARNTVDALEYTRELKRLKIGVIFLNDNIDTRENDGELRLTIMSSIAQEESRKTSDRVKWGQKRRMEQGVVFGGSLLGYDVAHGTMTINEEGAQVVRLIFHKFLREGKGGGTIARELCAQGVPGSRGKVKWSAQTVLKILKNEKYCGDLIQKKTFTPDYLNHEKKYNRGDEELVVLWDHHTPIIDREIWDEVQLELRRRRSAPDRSGRGNRYAFSGKITCGVCGRSFVCRTRSRADGSQYRRWCCGTAARHGRLTGADAEHMTGCDVGWHINHETVAELVRRAINDVTMNRNSMIMDLTRMIEGVIKKSKTENDTQIRKLELELETLMVRKERVMTSFLDRTLSEADFRFANDRCDAAIQTAREMLDQLRQNQEVRHDTDGLCGDIWKTVGSVVAGESADDVFFGHLLDNMTVYKDSRVEVALKHLPARWIFVLDGVAVYKKEAGAYCDASVPMSVSKPFASA